MYGQAAYYYDLNFCSVGAAYYTLFMVMIQNNWHVTAEGYEAVYGKGARVYFLAFNLFVSVVMVNIVIGARSNHTVD